MMTDGVFRMHRPGWRGPRDHFVALIMRRDQETVPVPITFSVWVKADAPVRLDIEQAQIETER